MRALHLILNMNLSVTMNRNLIMNLDLNLNLYLKYPTLDPNLNLDLNLDLNMKPEPYLEFDRELKLKTDTLKVPGRLQPQWPSTIWTFGNKNIIHDGACVQHKSSPSHHTHKSV